MGNDVNLQYPVGPTTASDGVSARGRAARTGEQVMSNVHGKDYEQASRGNMFYVTTLAVAPVQWDTEAGTGGPFLYNKSTTHNASLIKVIASTIVSATQAGSVVLVTAYDEDAPTTSTAAGQSGSCLISTATTRMTVLDDATVIGTNRGFITLFELGTAAITVETARTTVIDIDGAIVVPPRALISIAGNVVLSAWQAYITFIYEEVPV